MLHRMIAIHVALLCLSLGLLVKLEPVGADISLYIRKSCVAFFSFYS